MYVFEHRTLFNVQCLAYSIPHNIQGKILCRCNYINSIDQLDKYFQSPSQKMSLWSKNAFENDLVTKHYFLELVNLQRSKYTMDQLLDDKG